MEIKYILVALFIASLEGLAPILHKHLLGNISPTVLMVISSLAYSVFVLIFAIYHRKTLYDDIPKLSMRDLGLVAVSAGITGFVVNILYYTILQKHESYIIAALIYSSPVFTMIFLYLFMKYSLNSFSVLGVICIVLGVMCIALSEAGHKTENFII
jgi:uncharacterized membrane protein